MSRPTIFEAAGGSPAFEALTVRFYEIVKADPLLSPVFASFTAEHAKNVAIWLGEVFGGSWLSTSTEPSFEWTAAVTRGQADGGRVYGVIRHLATDRSGRVAKPDQ